MKVLHAAEVVKGGVSTVMRQLLEDQYSWDKIGSCMCNTGKPKRGTIAISH